MFRVQSHAASSLINFCEAAQAESVEPYVNLLIGKLVGLLQGGQTIVQEQAVTALAAIADCIEEKFTPVIIFCVRIVLTSLTVL